MTAQPLEDFAAQRRQIGAINRRIDLIAELNETNRQVLIKAGVLVDLMDRGSDIRDALVALAGAVHTKDQAEARLGHPAFKEQS